MIEQNETPIFRDYVKGAQNLKTISTAIVLMIGGLGFFLAGLSSYFQKNLLVFTDTSTISFLPQGITMLFYGTCACSLALFLFLFIFFDIGGGYNECSKKENLVRLVRKGIPGKNRIFFSSYEFQTIQKIKVFLKGGLNPRNTLYLILKDKREIPLYPPQFLYIPEELEKKAIYYSNFLNVPLEIQKM